MGEKKSLADERVANAIDRRLGQRVRTRRLEIGMSQEQLAEKLGVTFQQVQKYEKGVNRIAASRLHDIGVALDMSVAQIFDGIAPVRQSGRADNGLYKALATPEGAEMMTLFASIRSARMRRRALDLMRALVAEN